MTKKISKLKTGDIASIIWRDSAFAEGPRLEADMPRSVLVTTIGIFTEEQDDALVVCGETIPEHGTYRYAHAILKVNIESVKKLK